MDEGEAKRRRVDPQRPAWAPGGRVEPPAPMELTQLPKELLIMIIDRSPDSALMSLKVVTKLTGELAMADPRHASIHQIKTAVLAFFGARFRHAVSPEARLAAVDAYRGPRLQLIKGPDGAEFAAGRNGLWFADKGDMMRAYDDAVSANAASIRFAYDRGARRLYVAIGDNLPMHGSDHSDSLIEVDGDVVYQTWPLRPPPRPHRRYICLGRRRFFSKSDAESHVRDYMNSGGARTIPEEDLPMVSALIMRHPRAAMEWSGQSSELMVDHLDAHRQEGFNFRIVGPNPLRWYNTRRYHGNCVGLKVALDMNAKLAFERWISEKFGVRQDPVEGGSVDPL